MRTRALYHFVYQNQDAVKIPEAVAPQRFPGFAQNRVPFSKLKLVHVNPLRRNGLRAFVPFVPFLFLLSRKKIYMCIYIREFRFENGTNGTRQQKNNF